VAEGRGDGPRRAAQRRRRGLDAVGHGIGLALYETPVVSRIWSLDFPGRLKPRMTLALETLWLTEERSYKYPCGQAVRIEEVLHVTKRGVEVLSKWPVDEIIVCEI